METTQVTKYRREVLRRIAQYTWNDELPDHVYDIIYQTVRDDTPRVRCCVHKERAVLKNRIQMALWQPLGFNIINAAKAALAGEFDKSLPVMDVLPDACDACPIDRYYVTDVCRHCIQHKCIDNCPKQAISIQQNRATIDRDICIECGRCSNSCPYGAIIEINRPCIEACALGAMSVSKGDDTRTVIDHEKCVSCGNCRSACPFGALEDRTMIVPLLLALKSKKRPVVAMLAPSFVGQLGMKVTPGAIIAGLRELGFTAVVEVAVGADMTTLHEAEEFMEKVPAEVPFMTSSCCPAFVDLVRKHFPEYEANISETTSPMISCARWVKDKYKNAQTCFIGPCTAKKSEAIRFKDDVDFVLTYEEMACIFEGAGVDLTVPSEEYETKAAAAGIGFPLNRGVQESMKKVLPEDRAASTTMEYAGGLDTCQQKLSEIKAGKLSCEYFEGMACANGCIDGPGALAQHGLTRVMITKFAGVAPKKKSDENHEAVDAQKKLNLDVK